MLSSVPAALIIAASSLKATNTSLASVQQLLTASKKLAGNSTMVLELRTWYQDASARRASRRAALQLKFLDADASIKISQPTHRFTVGSMYVRHMSASTSWSLRNIQQRSANHAQPITNLQVRMRQSKVHSS
jgi:hypothetical protein